MTTKNTEEKQNEHSAKASAQNISVSTKHCIEICSHLRYKSTAQAKKILENVVDMKTPIPFKRFKRAMGHKPGMAAGRFPQKAASEVLKLVKSVEANAQAKGLNTSYLKIIKMLANKAATPMTGGRQRTSTKRTHVEIEVVEGKEKKKKQRNKKAEPKTTEKKTEKPAEGKTEAKKEVKEKATENIEPDKKVETEPKQDSVEEKTEPVKDEKPAEELKKEPVKEESKDKPTGEQAK